MSWNYRVIHRRYPVQAGCQEAAGSAFEASYAIHEVYYDDNGQPDGCTAEPAKLYGDSLEGLRKDYELMGEALGKPVLEWDDFVSAGDVMIDPQAGPAEATSEPPFPLTDRRPV